MLPVWFLTWQESGRVAYSVVNGQTGKVTSELPVDIKLYLLFSLIAAIPLFFVLQINLEKELIISSIPEKKSR